MNEAFRSRSTTEHAVALQQQKHRHKKKRFRWGILLLLLVCTAGAIFGISLQKARQNAGRTLGSSADQQGPAVLCNAELPDWVDQQIVPVNGAGRRGVALEDITDIVIHYVGNPGTTAQQNRDYYAQADTSVSSHFLIGMKGEVIQCIPLNEKSSASNDRNRDTISIEVCHPDESGAFTEESYASLVKLTAWLCKLCDFDSDEVIRHYDVTGKECPLYYVKNEDKWKDFLSDVDAALKALK